MNSTLCKTESWMDGLFHETTETPAPRDLYETMPVKAMRLEFDWQREEEAYTSFEAAISHRVLALRVRNISMNEETSATTHKNEISALKSFVSFATGIWQKRCGVRAWRRSLLLATTALMLMLVGFDLMGLLVLYAR